MAKLPLVAIIGRANVGKSSLFNVLIGHNQAVTAREAGTTRDTHYAPLDIGGGRYVLLADTAGLKAKPEDAFEASIQDQIVEATQAADALLVVVDAASILSDEDRRVAKTALRSKKPVILLVNKADTVKKLEDSLEIWRRTGIKDIFATSATQRRGLDDVLAWLRRNLAASKALDTPELSVSLIGRPNVGKSSLFNTLAKKQQAIVSERAGTTRDINRTTVRYHGQAIELLDTAGIRRPGRIERGIEQFSVLRAISAIDEADICLLLIDAQEPAVALEQKLAGMVKDAGKGLVLVITKWDIAEKDAYTHDQMAARIQGEFQHVWWAPLIFTSAETGQNITKLLELAREIHARRQQQFKTPELNQLIQDAQARHPAPGLKNRMPKLRYITQSDVSPPAFRIYGSKTDYLHWSYKRHLERLMREKYDLTGTPIKFYFSDGDKDEKYKPQSSSFRAAKSRDRT